ncbi:DNA replication and repair protein RecF [Candidatus Saccharibacteria bacterium]|nr:MAG: DNA replication and repair protein RecF [Candidatus Saccharibacteria bacterium]
MKLKTLRVQNFRNHDSFICDFSPTTTLIYGKNGSGKTALLEAIYETYRGVSFRGSDENILNTRHQWYRVDTADDMVRRTILFDNRSDKSIKQFIVDGKKSLRLPVKYKFPIILFTPDDLRLIGGSPARRRKYLDTVIGQYDTTYTANLRRYERALLQRNKLLKRPDVSQDMLFSWDIILSQTGAQIIAARHNFVGIINQQLTSYYRQIAGGSDILGASYTHVVLAAPTLLAQYEANFARDHLLGTTSVGPHRHDFMIELNTSHASDTASRGEVRTIVLALKYIEASIVHRHTDIYPLVLLDDVFGELDTARQKNLLRFFVHNQVIISSTNKHRATKTITLYSTTNST